MSAGAERTGVERTGVAVAPRWTPARVFLLATLAFGIPMVFVSPPLTAPDEGRHMARIYTLTDGHLRVPAEARVPRSLVLLERRVTRLWPPLRPEVQRPGRALGPLREIPLRPAIEAPARNLPAYGPLAYAPQALGFAVGRALDATPVTLVWLGRAANLFAWALIVAAALRVTPLRAWSFAALALLPMSLFLAASLSADAPTHALALLFLAAVLRAGFGPAERARPADLALACGAVAALGLTKGGYWPLAAAALVIPVRRFRRPRHWWLAMVAVALAGLVPSGLWFATARETAYTRAGAGADWAAQLEFLARHPIGYARIFLDSWLETGGAYAATFLGVLGRLDVALPAWLYALLAAALVALPLAEGRDPAALGRGRRAALVALCGLCTVAVFTMIYLSGNAVGAPLIRGVQGRYLLPLAPLLLLALPGRGRPGGPPALPLLVAAGAAASSAVALHALWQRYYL